MRWNDHHEGWSIHLSLQGGWVWGLWRFDCVEVYLGRGRKVREDRFQRSLVTGPSAFDRFLLKDKNARTPTARRGCELFYLRVKRTVGFAIKLVLVGASAFSGGARRAARGRQTTRGPGACSPAAPLLIATLRLAQNRAIVANGIGCEPKRRRDCKAVNRHGSGRGPIMGRPPSP